MHTVAKGEASSKGSKRRKSPLSDQIELMTPLVARAVQKQQAEVVKKRAVQRKLKLLSIFSLVDQNLWEQTNYVRNGLPSRSIQEISEALDMPRANLLANLQLARSTIEARIKNKKPLSPAEGDAVLRTAKAFAKAEEVFEDREAASAWLKREIRSLGGVTPISLMDTDSGFELVMRTLGRIEYGVVA